MSSIELLENEIVVANMPVVAGLRFRGFQGEMDYPRIVEIINGSREADQSDWLANVEEMTVNYTHLTNL